MVGTYHVRQRPDQDLWADAVTFGSSPSNREVRFEPYRDEYAHAVAAFYLQARRPFFNAFEVLERPHNYMYPFGGAEPSTTEADVLKVVFVGASPASGRSTLFISELAALRNDFESHRKLWEIETGFLSSITAKIMHPSYLRIIGMGKQVLPLIFEQMKREPGHWFVALEAITGENPVHDEADFISATEQWINWGRSKGYTD